MPSGPSCSVPLVDAGLVMDGDVVVGAWYRDHHALLEPQAAEVGACVTRAAGRHGGRPVACDVISSRRDAALPHVPTTVDWISRPDRRAGRARTTSLPLFLARVRQLRNVSSRRTSPHAAMRLRDRVASLAETLGLRPEAVDARLVADCSRALNEVGRFVDTLDPWAVELFRITGMDQSDDAYVAADRTFDPHAPLGAALERHPAFPRAVMQAHRREPHVFRWGTLHDRLAGFDVHLRSLWLDVPDVGRVATDLMALPVRARDRMHRVVQGVDLAPRLALLLRDLPADWRPRTEADWVALAECDDVVTFARHAAGPEGSAGMVGGKGRWADLVARLRRVELAHADEGGVTLGPARDMAQAFLRQVLGPAAALDEDEGDLDWPRTAQALLFGGRSVHRILEMARDWHRRRGGVDAVVEALPKPEGAVSSWPAGLPDHALGPMSVVVLRSQAELDAEGASGTAADGTEGLDHCVGGYGSRCRAGHVRIVSVRRRGRDGTERLSTAEVVVDRGRCHVVQHKGRSNRPPPLAAVEFLEAYVGALGTTALPVDAAGLRPLPVRSDDPLSEDAGYDVHVGGAVTAVLDAWRPLLPARARELDAAGLARHAASLARTGPWWTVHERVEPQAARGRPRP